VERNWMNPHFVEILKAFRDEGVEHLVIVDRAAR
jgi:hypothetical protein